MRYFLSESDLSTEFFFILVFAGALVSFFIFLLFWLTNQNAMFKS